MWNVEVWGVCFDARSMFEFGRVDATISSDALSQFAIDIGSTHINCVIALTFCFCYSTAHYVRIAYITYILPFHSTQTITLSQPAGAAAAVPDVLHPPAHRHHHAPPVPAQQQGVSSEHGPLVVRQDGASSG